MTTNRLLAEGIEWRGAVTTEQASILSDEAARFVAALHRKFDGKRLALLAKRREVQAKISDGWNPDFLNETQEIRASSWKVSPPPNPILDRRVEITGPVDRKMVINALNSGARVYMADFEDSHSPTWSGTLDGQVNLRDAVNGTIAFKSPEGKDYRVDSNPAVLFVRPRGWHLVEKHFTVDGAPVSGGLFDFGLFFFHNAQTQLKRGLGPYFYLPKMESHLEARLWNEVFTFAQKERGISHGTIKATVLIETILAAFEMDEILYELKDHSAGLNCGRWDYIFSYIKKFRSRPEFLVPDRAQVTMDVHFLKSYSSLLIQTCHRRGIHAMGGMAAQIPNRHDPVANETAFAKVRADKIREAKIGHDGTWVAHPGLVKTAMEIFDAEMKGANQIERLREDVRVSAADLLKVPTGTITEGGLRTNINVGLGYMEAWIRGSGCVPLHGLMEDAATAEISRAQIWQWLRNPGGRMGDGTRITQQLFKQILQEERDTIASSAQSANNPASVAAIDKAAALFEKIVLDDEFAEFLTLPAYELLP